MGAVLCGCGGGGVAVVVHLLSRAQGMHAAQTVMVDCLQGGKLEG